MHLEKIFPKIKASSSLLLAFCVYFSVSAQENESIKNLNSPYDEQHAVLSPSGELFFSIGYHPENTGGPADFGDVYMSSKNAKGNWTKATRVPGLSTAGNDVVVGFPDPVTIYVYHSGSGKPQGIHQYAKFGSDWNYVRPLQMGSFRNNSSHFSARLSGDSIIIMSMNTYGSYGNEDLYISFKQSEGIWSSPENLGPTINSFAQEQTPFLSKDQQTLYFSTNANANGKGKNIHYAQRLNDSWKDWTSPQLLENVNSNGSDSGYAPLFPENNLALLTSTKNSDGFADFFQVRFEEVEPIVIEEEVIEEVAVIAEEKVEIEEKVQEVQVQVKPDSVINKIVINPPVIIQDTVIKETVAEYKAVEMVKIEEVQKAEPAKVEEPIVLPILAEEDIIVINDVKVLEIQTQTPVDYQLTLANEKGITKQLGDYESLQDAFKQVKWTSILVSAQGYLPTSLSVAEWNNLENNTLYLIPAKSGASLVLNNIQFVRGTSDFEDAISIQVLDQLVAFMQGNREIKIRLEGHTDNAGDPVLNKELSLKRASKIRAYLTLKGIDFERIRISGWGGTRPVGDNNTEEGRELNRRVEMYIER
jgi:outer membrane protein OmpA-like peptidoglycan-associated protein